MEIGLLVALLSPQERTEYSPQEQANQKWCRVIKQSVLLNAEGSKEQDPFKICENLLKSKQAEFADDYFLDDCYDLLRQCKRR